MKKMTIVWEPAVHDLTVVHGNDVGGEEKLAVIGAALVRTIKEFVENDIIELDTAKVFMRTMAELMEKEIALLKKQLADAQPVQHGRWIPEYEDYVDDTYICSVCGYEFIITAGDLESNELNYCPRCGAKMDGGKS